MFTRNRMDTKQIFYNQLKEDFIPVLRESGFKGSGQNFRRVTGEVIHAINIQNYKYGGSCCINLGLHFTFLPACWNSNSILEAQKIKEIDCEFRSRLTPKGENDYWWKFEGNEPFGSTSESIKHLCETYQQIGCGFFEEFNSVESLTSAIEISLLKQADYIDVAGGIVPVRGALTMARIYQHLGNRELQQEYATTGLEILGNAKSLKMELERLAK